MFGKSASDRSGLSRRVPQPLTSEETRAISGGGSNVQHGNAGGEPASYNIHTSTGPGPAWYNLS